MNMEPLKTPTRALRVLETTLFSSAPTHCCHSAEARGNKGAARQNKGWAGARCPRASVCGASGAFSRVGRSPDQNGALRSSGEPQAAPTADAPSLGQPPLCRWGGDEPLPGGVLGRRIWPVPCTPRSWAATVTGVVPSPIFVRHWYPKFHEVILQVISEKGFFILKETQEILKGISYLLSDRKPLGGYVLRGNTVTQLSYFLVLGLGFPISEMGIKAASI